MIKNSGDTFIFDSVTFDQKTMTVIMRYICGEYIFEECVSYDNISTPKNLDTATLQRALKMLHLITGISYYKAFALDATSMRVNYDIPVELANYLNHVYEEGLGEFYFQNNLEPTLLSRFSGVGSTVPVNDADADGYVVGLGGGKDSLTAIKLLQIIGEKPITTYGVNAPNILVKQAGILGTEHFQVNRNFDLDGLKSVESTDGQPVLNGHVPISAILASIGLVGAILSGKSAVIVAVERSANEPTRLDYMGKSINHQYSKSSDFELAFNSIIKSWISSRHQFFSVLRPLRELDIMKLFFAMSLEKEFAGEYTSCNRAINFTNGNQNQKLWCGECDKCAFMFLLMSGAGRYGYATELFGEDLISKPMLKHVYCALLGLTDSKPFECAGEIEESRQSMDIAKATSENAKLFSYPATGPDPVLWDSTHAIPKELADKLQAVVIRLLLAYE